MSAVPEDGLGTSKPLCLTAFTNCMRRLRVLRDRRSLDDVGIRHWESLILYFLTGLLVSPHPVKWVGKYVESAILICPVHFGVTLFDMCQRQLDTTMLGKYPHGHIYECLSRCKYRPWCAVSSDALIQRVDALEEVVTMGAA